MECIKVTNLSKTYNGKEVVKKINFAVAKGEIFAFLGPNGAGKSTTMNMLATLIYKTEGNIYIEGRNIDKAQNEIKKKIGVVFQEDTLDLDLTVYQNLYYRGGLYIEEKEDLIESIKKVAKLLKIENIFQKKYSKCSGGQKRLVQIARALIPAPKLLILDEPSSSLDEVARENMWKVLKYLKNKLNITIFYTTHYMDEVNNADKVCILKSGKVLVIDSLDNIYRQQSSTNFKDIYLNILKEGVK
ncbi:MAG: ABC transporter ATP-binding protein [Clostridia bacterium]